jgi:hypothetical protein
MGILTSKFVVFDESWYVIATICCCLLVIGNNQVFLMIYETHSNYFEVVAKL